MKNIQQKLQMMLFILIATLAVACSSPEKDKKSNFENALGYIEKNQNEAAILELRSAIQIDPKYAAARYQLGLLYLEQGEPKKAYGEIIRAADLDPDNLDASLKAAQFHLMARQKDESRKRLNHIFQKDPEHRDALILLADLELIEGEFDAAMTTLKKLGEEVETSAQLQNLKGRILVAKQDWVMAEDAFRKAIVLDDNSNIAHYFMLIRFYDEKKEHKNAKKLLDQMLENFPENVEAHTLMARYYSVTGQKDLMESELQTIIELAPDEPRHRLQLAYFFRQENDYKRAEESLVKAQSNLPESEEIQASLASLYFDQQKFDESSALLEKLNTAQADYREVKLLTARFQFKDGKVDEGMTLLQELNNDFPTWADPYFHLGFAHQSRGEVDLAKMAIGNAIKNDKNDSRYHTLLAQLYLTEGSFEDAEKEARMSLSLTRNVKAAIILGRSFIGAKDFNNGVKIFTDLNKQFPNNIEILDGFALALIGIEDFSKAEKTLLEIMDIDPGHNRALSLYLNLKYKNDTPGAIVFVQQQLQKSPDDFRLHFLLGNLLNKNGQKQEALLSYENAQKINPTSPGPYLAAAQLLSNMGEKDQAFAKYEEVLKQQPDSLSANMGLAALYEAQGDSKTAIEHYQTVLVSNEDFAPAANNLAWLIASEPDGDLGKALQLIMVAKQAYPENANIADTLGWIHYKRESYSLAITQFKHALETAPDNPTIRYHLALALVGNEEPGEAINTLEELLRLDVDFADKDKAKELLAQLKQK